MALIDLLARKLIAGGIEITDTSVTAVLLKKRKDKLRLAGSATIELEAGIVSQQKVIDAKRLIKALKQVAKKAKLNRRYVVVAIPEAAVFTQMLTIPNIPADQVHEYLALNLPTSLPFTKNDVAFAWEKVESQSLRNEQSLFLTSASRLAVNALADAVDAAGMTPIAIEADAAAIARVIASTDQQKQLTIFIRPHASLYTVTQNGHITFSLSTDSGYKDIAQVGNDPIADFAKNILDQVTRISRFQNQAVAGISLITEQEVPTLHEKLVTQLKLPIMQPSLPLELTERVKLNRTVFLPAFGAAERGINLSKSDQQGSLLPFTAGMFYQHRHASSIYRALFNIAIGAALTIAAFLFSGYSILTYQKYLLAHQASSVVLATADRQLITDVSTLNKQLLEMGTLYRSIPHYSQLTDQVLPTIEGIRYTSYAIGIDGVSISGNAATLDNLKSLIAAYRSNPVFSSVDVPNQFLGQAANIDFTIKLKLNLEMVKPQ